MASHKGIIAHPPGGSDAKFHSRSKKGIHLGFPKNTAKNVIWHGPETDNVIIAKHACFDEGMNDLPIHKLPPNALQLHVCSLSLHSKSRFRAGRVLANTRDA